MATPILELRHVHVSLARRPVLDDIHVAVYPGQFVGVIGPNGAGKTTLLRVILGLLSPTDGQVLIHGTPVHRGSRLVGYVPQALTGDANPPLRARDLVDLGIDGERWGLPMPGRARRARVDAVLERVGARHYANAPLGALSGGERQRLLIAQALVSEPRILLLDEPLSNLDIKSAHETVELVAELVRERGIAALLVAHDMNPLLGSMDQVLYLAHGRAAVGPVEDVVRSEVLTALYGYAVEVLRVQGRVVVVTGDAEAAVPTEVPHHPAGQQTGSSGSQSGRRAGLGEGRDD
ncbi:MAG: metal ABC transporter ATP-binding protein [Clostridia bacterium]